MRQGKLRATLPSRAPRESHDSPRLTPELVQSAERVRVTYRAMLPFGSVVRGRLVGGTRRRHWYHVTSAGYATSALARLDHEMVQLRNAGLTEAEMLRIEQHVRETRERLYAGKPMRTRDELDRAETQAEATENILSLEARLHPSPETYRALAEASRTEAAVEEERAHVYSLEAAKLEREGLMSFPRPMGARS